MQGTVNAAYEAVVSLPLRGPAGQARDVDAVVDTGFTRFLTLPSAMVVELGLGFRGVNRVILADGSETTLEVYGLTVLWDGQPREVRCLCLRYDTPHWDVFVAQTQPGHRRRGGRASSHTGEGVASSKRRMIVLLAAFRRRMRRRGRRRTHTRRPPHLSQTRRGAHRLAAYWQRR